MNGVCLSIMYGKKKAEKQIDVVLNDFGCSLQPLASAFGLAKHRDGRWEWAVAPGISPAPRYQHAAVSHTI